MSMAEKPIYLIAAGGHGRVVLDALISRGVAVSGIVDPRLAVGSAVFGVPVVGDDVWLDECEPNAVALVNGFGAAANTQRRLKQYQQWLASGFEIAGVRHPSAIIGAECSLAGSSQIMAGTVLQNRVVIADNVVVNTRVSIDHDCQIQAHVFIAPGVTLCGDVIIGEGAFVGAGAVVMPGMKVGAHAIVGAGSVVLRDIASYETVAGNPAQKLKPKA